MDNHDKPFPIRLSTVLIAIIVGIGLGLCWNGPIRWKFEAFLKNRRLPSSDDCTLLFLTFVAGIMIFAFAEGFARTGWKKSFGARIVFELIAGGMAIFNIANNGFPAKATTFLYYEFHHRRERINEEAMGLNILFAFFAASAAAWIYKLFFIDKVERGWFRVHLSTALLLMIAASLLLWANIAEHYSGTSFEQNHLSSIAYAPANIHGWPFVVVYSWFTDPQNQYTFVWQALAANALISMWLLFGLATVSESFARRRER